MSKRSEYPLILARCYGDEPRVLEVRKVEPMGTGKRYRYVVARPGSPVTIGWHPDFAYAYSADLFAELLAAYTAGDVGRLYALWRSAPRPGSRPERAPAIAVDFSRSSPNDVASDLSLLEPR